MLTSEDIIDFEISRIIKDQITSIKNLTPSNDYGKSKSKATQL